MFKLLHQIPESRSRTLAQSPQTDAIWFRHRQLGLFALKGLAWHLIIMPYSPHAYALYKHYIYKMLYSGALQPQALNNIHRTVNIYYALIWKFVFFARSAILAAVTYIYSLYFAASKSPTRA